MATPPTPAISSGDFSTPFETSPTTRVTGKLERTLAPTFNNPASPTRPDRRGSGRGRAAV
jgi:hypothetical protein